MTYDEVKSLQEQLEFANKSAAEAIDRFFEQQRKITKLYGEIEELKVEIARISKRVQSETAKAIFKEMYELVTANDDCTIIINANDVKAIAKRYNVKL